MKRLIVNADDFGIHAVVNQGIAAGHTCGVITSASLMAGGDAFDDAVRIAGEQPSLAVGAHLTLVGGGKPVLSPQAIPGLLDAQGFFLSGHPAFLARYLAGRIKLAEVELELTAQLEKICAAGLVPSHLDSHQHLHVLPGIFAVVARLAKRFSIRAIRKPAETVCFFGGARPSLGRVAGRTGLSLLAAGSMCNAKRNGFVTTDHFYGMLSGGQLNEALMLELIDVLQNGSTEIMTHPGCNGEELAGLYNWGYHWEEELQALISPVVRERLRNKAIELISFRDL